jgi:hypothetical protein
MRILLLALVALALHAGEADTPLLDRFNLTNGRAVVGTVESETPDAYTVRLPGGQGGALVIKKDRVVSVDKGAEKYEAPKPQEVTPESTAAAAAIAQNKKAPDEKPAARDPLDIFTNKAVVNRFEKGWIWVNAGWDLLNRDEKARLIAEGAKVFRDTVEVHSFTNDRMLAFGSEKGVELNPQRQNRTSVDGGFAAPR